MKRSRSVDVVVTEAQSIVLPNDVWSEIFSHLRYISLRVCTLVCRVWHFNDFVYMLVKKLGYSDMCHMDMTHLARMYNLESLAMSGSCMKGSVTDRHLSGFTKLRSLSVISMPNMSDHSLKGLRNLNHLSIRGITRVSLEALKALPKLETLYTQNTTDYMVEGLSTTLTNLTALHIPYESHTCRVNFSMLTRLKTLNLSCNQSFVCESIKRLTNLERLNLTGTGGNVEGLGIRSLWRNLTYLHVMYSNKKLSCADLVVLTNLRELRIDFNAHIGDEVVTRLTNLTALSVGYSSIVSESGLSCLTKLQKLSLGNNTTLSSKCINALPSLTTLFIFPVYSMRQNFLNLREGITLVEKAYDDSIIMQTDSL